MFRYLFDREIPLIKKLPIIGWLVYLISPADLIPDPVLGLGILDDAVILMFLLSFIDGQLRRYSSEKTDNNVINNNIIEDVEYKVDKDEDL